MLSRELLYFKYLGFEIQLKPEQRKSIINLLRGEDAGYRDSSYGIRKSLIFQLYIVPISLVGPLWIRKERKKLVNKFKIFF
jgi:hypothetical protein